MLRIFETSENKMGLVCNTEKDRVRVNNKTAGIINGISIISHTLIRAVLCVQAPSIITQR